MRLETQNSNLNLLQNRQQNQNKQKKDINFKGAGFQSIMNFLQTNQAGGATFVDAAFMCTPRTAFDTIERGPSAGVETGFREYSSNVNDAAMGAYAMGASTLMASCVNKNYNIKAQNLFVDNDTLEMLADIRNEKGDLNVEKNMKSYLEDIFSNTKAFSPSNPYNKIIDDCGWVGISSKTQEEIVKKLSEDIPKINDNKAEYKKTRDYIKALLISDTGSDGDFKIVRSIVDKNTSVKKEVSSSVGDYVDKIMKVSKAFMSQEVSKEFANGAENAFVKAIKRLNAKTAIGGIAICSAVGAAVQPLNVWMTKKRTGQTGFVGGGEENKSTSFKVLKTVVSALGLTAAIATIGSPKDLLKNLQFKGLVPTISQFKFVYGITIVSRFLFARNGTELRESATKDPLAFVNWLILGGFVSNLTAMALECTKFAKKLGFNLINYNANESMKKRKAVPKWIAGKVVTREEILQQALKKLNISPIENGKAMNFKQMYKKLKSLKNSDVIAKNALKSLKLLTFVQLAGYIYSGVALGLLIPKLNLVVTNAVNKNKEQKAEAERLASLNKI